ncbi:MAG: hypothetical protein R3F13_18695 [Prosthecobacter sp.]
MKQLFSLPGLVLVVSLISTLAEQLQAGGIEVKSKCGNGCEPDHGAYIFTFDDWWQPSTPYWTTAQNSPKPQVGDKFWVGWGWNYYEGELYLPHLWEVIEVMDNPANPDQYRELVRMHVYEFPSYLFEPSGSLLPENELIALAERPSCSATDRARAAVSTNFKAGHAMVTPPGLGGDAYSGGCTSCSSTGQAGARFKVAISLGGGIGGVPELSASPAGQIVFNGDLAQGDMLSLANFAAVGGAGWMDGSFAAGATVTARELTSNTATATAAIQTASANGLLQTVTITVTPQQVGAVQTTHVFERVAETEGVFQGVRYTRTEGTESESMTFFNTGTDMPSSNTAIGAFKTVNPDGSVEIWIAPPDTFVWVADASHANGGYFTMDPSDPSQPVLLTETHEFIPADVSQPKVVTERMYGKIGDEYDNERVLLSETVSQVLGATALSIETTRYGYDEQLIWCVSTQNPAGKANDRFGQRVWTVNPDGSWLLEVAQELPTVTDYYTQDWDLVSVDEFTYGDVMQFTPWLNGPALPADFDTRAGAETFFADLLAEARSSSNFIIAGCRRIQTTRSNTPPAYIYEAWKEKRVESINGETYGIEYGYKDAWFSSLNVDTAWYYLDARQERWNASETSGTWSASASGYANLSVSLDHTGMARISSTSTLAAGGTVTDSWQFTATANGGYGPNRKPPNYTAGTDFPLWSTTTYDDQGRVFTEDSKLRVDGTDHTLQTIGTAYSGETGSTRSLGTTVLSSQAEDVIANGVRTSSYTDVQGVTTITKTDEDTGELISETKQGVAASGDYLAQPDVTTSYAKSTNATTGETTQTVTQTDGTTTRTLSITVTDAQGRTKSVTDEIGRVTSYDYANHGRTVTETLPGGGTRITETYLDGQLKSVTGTAVTAEYHDYTVNDGTVAAYEAGSITETVHYGTSDGAHWRKTTTNFLGQVLREEEPSPAAAAGGVIATTHEYNAKGQRVRSSRTGTVDLRFEYDDFGRMVRQGYDVSGDGVLTVASSDVLTEVLTSYEEQDGAWVEKTIQRTHTQPNGEFPLDTVTRRGLREDVSWQSTTATDGSVTVYTDWTSAAGHLHGTQVLRSADGVSIPVTVQTSVSYNGLQVAQSVPGATTPVIFGYDGFGRMTSQIHPVAGTSGWAYNSSTGQLETQTPAGGSAITYTYYPATHANAGQMASVTANGQVTRYAYDAQGRQTHQWGTGSQPLKYVYDALGRLHELHTYQGGTGWDSETLPDTFASATAAVTTWDYREGTSALWKKTDAANHSVVYAYGTDGLRETKTNARNITTTYTYETVGTQKLPGRLTRLTYSDGTPEVVMSYKRSGELGTVSDAAGLSTFTGTASERTVTVTGDGLMTGLLVGRTEHGPDQPETVLAQVGGTTVVSNQHAWTDAGLLSQPGRACGRAVWAATVCGRTGTGIRRQGGWRA